MASKCRGTQEYLIVYAELINAARCRGTVTYTEIAEIMGLPPTDHYMGAEVGHMAGEISEAEHANGRPLLGALAVSGVTGSVGSGFFVLARRLGKLQGTTPNEERHCWKQERAAVYETW